MLSVGLTGNVAAGKSTVAELWQNAGVPVISADRLARDVVRPGSEALAQVVDLLGPEVLSADGTMDRAAVRGRVFQDEDARRALEGILHPRIDALRRRWFQDRRSEGHTIAVAEVPLLFEVGLANAFDVTVLVDAPEEERLRRLVASRGLAPAEARRIMEAQMDPGRKRELADYVVDNGGSRAALVARATEVLESLRRDAGTVDP